LIIKNDPRHLRKLAALSKCSAFKTIKFIGFKDSDLRMDSLLSLVSIAIQPTVLIFENCDLSSLLKQVGRLPALKKYKS